MKTNADNLRQMSNEEMVEFLYCLLDGDRYCKNMPQCERMLDENKLIPDEWCKKCLLRWLSEPVEVT